MIHASENLHHISYTRRQCYLADERKLKYYEHYSLLNCLMECQANVTWNHCHCNMYFQPRTPDHALCGLGKIDCYHKAVTVVETAGFAHGEDDDYTVPEGYEDADCKCLPACTDYEFPAQTSFSSITEAKQLHLPDYVTEARPELKEDSYVASNMAVLHIYF